jgi:IMP cyclohydrolase
MNYELQKGEDTMQALTIREILGGNAYPGRGILLGRSADAAFGVIAYFIMGRSENSRNRVFQETGDGIRTRAFDEAKLTDPSLVIYHPVRVVEGGTIVTNGDQTDTIRDFLMAGGTMEDALRTRQYEPDPPLLTPRVSGFLAADGAIRLSILKSAEGNPACNLRFFYEYDAPPVGEGRLIHTYQQDGNPPPSFEGEPRRVVLPYGDPAALAEDLWENLDENNRVSLFTRFVRLDTGEAHSVIINRHEGGRV